MGPVDYLKGMFDRSPVANPPLPDAPPLQRIVTRHGPTVDTLLNQLPEDLRGVYGRTGLRANPKYIGSPINASAQEGGDIVLNPDRLGADPDELFRTLAHEGQHKIQQRDPGFKSMSNEFQESDARKRAQLALNALISGRQ